MLKLKSLGLRPRSSNGLSLIEVCLAIAILAIIFTNLSFIFDQGYLFLRKTRLSRQAFLLAEERMEELLHENTVDSPNTYNETKGLKPYDPPFEAFKREVIINKTATSVLGCGGPGVAAGCEGRLAEVNVTIYWNGTSGEQSFSLVSLVANSTQH